MGKWALDILEQPEDTLKLLIQLLYIYYQQKVDG